MQLRAAVQHGKDLSRIEELLCVEGAFDPDLLDEITAAAQHTNADELVPRCARNRIEPKW
ncbi:MAG: hypothetical protein ACR2KT_13275 [Methylocella sp.]